MRSDVEAVLEDLRTKHGSADAIEQVIKDLESALNEAGDVPAFREEIRRLESRGKTLTTEIEAAGGTIVQVQADLSKAEKLYEQVHACARGAALRHELKPGEACPVCEQMVHTVPASPDARNLAKARERVAQTKEALRQAQSQLLEFRGELQRIPGNLDLALKQIEIRNTRVEQTTARAHMIVGNIIEHLIPRLRTLIEEIAKQISMLEASKKRRSELEANRKRLEVTLKQAESIVAECDKSAAALESGRARLEEAIRSLLKEITKRDKQLKESLGDIRLVETPDEATQFERMEASSRKELVRSSEGRSSQVPVRDRRPHETNRTQRKVERGIS